VPPDVVVFVVVGIVKDDESGTVYVGVAVVVVVGVAVVVVVGVAVVVVVGVAVVVVSPRELREPQSQAPL
jgi:Flp pilus assembly protein TadB